MLTDSAILKSCCEDDNRFDFWVEDGFLNFVIRAETFTDIGNVTRGDIGALYGLIQHKMNSKHSRRYGDFALPIYVAGIESVVTDAYLTNGKISIIGHSTLVSSEGFDNINAFNIIAKSCKEHILYIDLDQQLYLIAH